MKRTKLLQIGDTLGVCAPSSGVRQILSPHIDKSVSKANVLDNKAIEAELVYKHNKCVGSDSKIRKMEQGNHDELLAILNSLYDIRLDRIAIHRDMIGHVYIAEGQGEKYVFKLYRPNYMEQAIQSVGILQYLYASCYPVPKIIPLKDESSYITIDTLQGLSVGILFEFIDGIQPEKQTEIEHIGKQVGLLHNLVDKCPLRLSVIGEEFYIDRYVTMLLKMQCSEQRVEEVVKHGKMLWSRLSKLPQGFSHGDLHPGNMLMTKKRDYVLFDFDAAGIFHCVNDIAVMCDQTDYFSFKKQSYDDTARMFEHFYTGYAKERILADIEISAIYDFIAVRHFDIQATIVECLGLDCINLDFLDKQWEWLSKWEDLCRRKRV